MLQYSTGLPPPKSPSLTHSCDGEASGPIDSPSPHIGLAEVRRTQYHYSHDHPSRRRRRSRPPPTTLPPTALWPLSPAQLLLFHTPIPLQRQTRQAVVAINSVSPPPWRHCVSRSPDRSHPFIAKPHGLTASAHATVCTTSHCSCEDSAKPRAVESSASASTCIIYISTIPRVRRTGAACCVVGQPRANYLMR